MERLFSKPQTMVLRYVDMMKWMYLGVMAIVLQCCNKKSVYTVGTGQENPPVPPTRDTSLRYILSIGDSYTIGQSVPDSERFPIQTVALLGDSLRFVSPEIIAQTGWTTANLLFRLNNTPPKRSSYDIVTLLAGVNNQYQGRSQQEYRNEFNSLLLRAIQYADNRKKRVMVLSIPDWGVTPFANGQDRGRIARQIDSFNIINYELAQQWGVNYIDITPSTRLAATDRTLLAYDSLHPSGKEYAKWAGLLAPMVRQVLR